DRSAPADVFGRLQEAGQRFAQHDDEHGGERDREEGADRLPEEQLRLGPDELAEHPRRAGGAVGGGDGGGHDWLLFVAAALVTAVRESTASSSVGRSTPGTAVPAIKAAGVSRATSRPDAMTASRSQSRSASSMKCVTSTTVTPRSRTARMRSQVS